MARAKGGNAGEEKNSGTDNDSVGANTTEDAADAGALARPSGIARGVGNSELDNNRGNFNSAADRPYHGNWKGRLETRGNDDADSKLRAEASSKEQQTIKDRDAIYNQHGDKGWSGSWSPTWEVEA